MVLTITKPPADAVDWKAADAAVIIDASGVIEMCGVTASSGSAALDAIVCPSAVSSLAAVRDSQGVPVRSVQFLNIAFEVAPD